MNGLVVREADIRDFGGFGGETFDLSSDLGSPVSNAYAKPAGFIGRIEKVVLDLQPVLAEKPGQ